MDLKIRMCGGKEEIKLDINDEITVIKLKELIEEKNNILGAENMCLTYAGVVLINDKTLKDYKISLGSLII